MLRIIALALMLIAATAAAQPDPWTPRLGAPVAAGRAGALTHVVSKKGSAGAVVQDERATDVLQFFVNRSPAAPATDLTIRRVIVTSRSTAIYLGRASERVVIQDADLSGANAHVKAYSAGVKGGEEAVRNVLVERVYSHDWMTTQPRTYWNADGFANEQTSSGWTFRYTTAARVTDGCYDVKSTATRFEHTRAIDCNWGYRLHGTGTGLDMRCEGAMKACIQVRPGTDYTIDGVTFSDTPPALGDVKVEGTTGRLVLTGCNRPPKLHGDKAGFANVVLGAGCR